MTIRVGVAAFMQESNSFAPSLATLSDFEVRVGRDVVDFYHGTNSEVAGFLDSCETLGWKPIPLLAANAISGGPLARSCFEDICSNLITSISAQPLDGLLLALHGAMSVEGYPSGDAEIVRRVRKTLGARIPIVVSHDFHANVTPALLAQVNGLTGYRTYPHVDQQETGRRAGGMLARLIHGERSEHWYLPIPMLLSPQASSTFEPPLKELADHLATSVPDSSGTFATLFCVQPWLDFAAVASSLVVTEFVTDPRTGNRLKEWAARLWSMRMLFRTEWVSPETLAGVIRSSPTRPVLVSDASDSPTGGASGDHTGALACLLSCAYDVSSCAYIVDPLYAERARAAGVGTYVDGFLGARIDSRYSQPLRIRARVKSLSDGKFIAKGPAFQGRALCMGPTAVISIERLQIVVASKAVMMIDPELFRSQGVEPTDLDAVAIKSSLLFRPAYETISRTVVHLDLPGPCRGRLDRVEFQHINHPIYPIDDFEWYPPEPVRIVPE